VPEHGSLTHEPVLAQPPPKQQLRYNHRACAHEYRVFLFEPPDSCNRLIRLCVTVLLLLPGLASAQGLTYSVSGISGELERNVRAWLGEPPETVPERQNFIASARERSASALQALGYYNPEISITISRGQPVWTLALAVSQGEPVRLGEIAITLSGDAEDDTAFARLLANPGFASGDILHHGRYEKFRSELLSLAQRRGYFDARIPTSRIAVRAEDYTAAVTLHLDSGRRYNFGEFELDRALVSDGLLVALRDFAPGDPYLQSKLQDFQARLQATGFFAAVLAEPLPDAASDGRVPIGVSLHPAKRHSFDVGVGYSTDTEGRLTLAWRTPRINRFGHSQVSRVVVSAVNPSGRVNYNIPLTHPLDDLLNLWARAEENEFGDIDSRQLELGVRREIRSSQWVWGYSMRDLNESWTLRTEDNESDYLLLGGFLSRRDQRGPLLDPEAGFSQYYALEVASESAASDISLARLTSLLRYVATPLPRHRIVARADLGIAETGEGERPELAPSLSFFAGGNQSIRGFGYQSIGNEIAVRRDDGTSLALVTGGDRLAVLSLEYQYYLSDAWRGAVFIDGGDAFDAGEFNWNYGTGFGVHYLSPVGAVRVEFARDISSDQPEWRLHLNIGAEF